MGSWMYASAAAAKKKREQDARIARSKLRAEHAQDEIDAEREASDRKFWDDMAKKDYRRRHSIEGLYECALMEISHHNNKELFEFINALYEYGLKIDLQDSKELFIRGTALTEELKKKTAELEENRQKVEQSGITLEKNSYYNLIEFFDFYPITIDVDGKEQVVEYTYCASRSIKYESDEETFKHYYFNHLKLTEEMLRDPNYNGFDTECEKIKDKHKYSLDREPELLKRLKIDKIRLVFSILSRYDLKDEIHDIEQKLGFIENYKKEIESARALSETYKNLTPDQRKAILEYLQTRKQCEDLEHEIKENVCKKINLIYPYGPEAYPDYAIESNDNLRDKWNRTLRLMIEDGVIKQDDLLKVVNMIADVQQKQKNNEYDETFKSFGSTREIKSNKYTRGIKWFISNFYATQNKKEKHDKEEVK